MGQIWKLVNKDKKEVVSGISICQHKYIEHVLNGKGVDIVCLKLLLSNKDSMGWERGCDSFFRKGSPRILHFWIRSILGRWRGDRISFEGENSCEEEDGWADITVQCMLGTISSIFLASPTSKREGESNLSEGAIFESAFSSFRLSFFHEYAPFDPILSFHSKLRQALDVVGDSISRMSPDRSVDNESVKERAVRVLNEKRRLSFPYLLNGKRICSTFQFDEKRKVLLESEEREDKACLPDEEESGHEEELGLPDLYKGWKKVDSRVKDLRSSILEMRKLLQEKKEALSSQRKEGSKLLPIMSQFLSGIGSDLSHLETSLSSSISSLPCSSLGKLRSFPHDDDDDGQDRKRPQK